jgi:hypothetical protein
MSTTKQQLDHEFKNAEPAFYGWWKKKHDQEFRQGLSARVAWLCASYRDEFNAARGNVLDVDFAPF